MDLSDPLDDRPASPPPSSSPPHLPITPATVDLDNPALFSSPKDHVQNMERIEQEFGIIKDRFFSAQIQALIDELELIKTEKHDKFGEKVSELVEKKEERERAVEEWKNFQLQNIYAEYEAEKRQVKDDFRADKGLLRDRMIQLIDDRMKKIQEERSNLNLTDGTEHRNTRKLRRRGKEPPSIMNIAFTTPSSSFLSYSTANPSQSTKKRISQTLHINSIMMLKENEIHEDLLAIQKRPIFS
eukprot:TRINITY_DN8674_c0_g1_i1.p1 TRINITY_DN8674_c0_g1~~TRINITY_DN8674_c0_g1_i1.p1  ORF type:complete len:250 (+),score=87.26 TRINITY_DN8674_c0_g1_i1:27-752(+)